MRPPNALQTRTPQAPYPGATTAPYLDPKAPAERGTTVEVTYRNRPIVVEQGEPVRLAVCSSEGIERVFLAAITVSVNVPYSRVDRIIWGKRA